MDESYNLSGLRMFGSETIAKPQVVKCCVH